jgi:hypothetical protein
MLEVKRDLVAERIKELTKESSNGVVIATLVDDMVKEYQTQIEKLSKEVTKLCKTKKPTKTV